MSFCKRCNKRDTFDEWYNCTLCYELIEKSELERLRKIEEWAIKTRSAIQQHVEAGGTNDWLQLAVKRLDEIMDKK